ncbi:hypothetical protein [Flavobacterium sp. XGLA_31]|uniref:hypothetical protein n=1 Tax=Flavobacterium sp. XGLA_31 TaxID=3447666 RepID=UPI003F2B6575
MKKIILLIISVSSITNIYSQTIAERNKAISIIEDLTYDEYYLGTKCFEQEKINYDPQTGKIEIESYSYFGEDNNIRVKKVFYISDLYLKTIKIQTAEIEKEKYMLDINIEAKEGSVTQTMVTVDKKQFVYPVSKTEYLNSLNIGSVRTLPQYLLDKLLDNYKILLGIK